MGGVLHLPPRYPLRAQWLRMDSTEVFAKVGVLRLVVFCPGHSRRRPGYVVMGCGGAHAKGHWSGSLERTQYECTALAALQDTMAQLGDD
jgi:hypothetical protein